MKLNTFFLSIKINWIFIYCFAVFPVFAETPDAILLNQRTDLSVKNSKLYISRMYELQINNRNGEEYTEISIPYSKMMRVSKIEACIKDKDGIIVKKLKASDLKDRSSISDGAFYEDNFVKEFTLIHNVYPYTINYSYQQQADAFFYLDHWIPVLDKDIPTLDATLTLDIPVEFKIAYSSQFTDSLKTDTVDSRVKYTWKTSYTRQIEPEIHSPELSTFLPKVVIVPVKFKYDQEGSFESWETYGNWESRLLDKLNVLPEEEKQHITSLINGITDEKEKIRLLYHYLQDATRYINISIETGGMKPTSAGEVSINKYGDCKGLSNYFRSILSYVGIPSFYTNVQAGDVITKLNHGFPSMQFNHVILCVPLPNDTIWLDCTSDGPFNYLGTFTQNRPAFLIDSKNSYFKRTPVLSKDDVLESRKILINSDLGNGVIASFRTTLKGESFERLSSLTRLVSEEKKTQIIRNYFIDSGFEMIDYNLIPAHRDSTFITLQYTAKAEKLYKKYDKEILIPLIQFSVPPFKEPKYRKFPVQLNYPVNKRDTIMYQLPDGYQLSNLPKNQTLHTKYGMYSIDIHQRNNQVEVVKHFLLYAGEYPLTEYSDFYKFVKAVYDIEKYSYIIIKKTNES